MQHRTVLLQKRDNATRVKRYLFRVKGERLA
jgi:hypothetical protein